MRSYPTATYSSHLSGVDASELGAGRAMKCLKLIGSSASAFACRLMPAIFAALLLAVWLGGPVAAGPLEDARAAFQRGDYVTAARLYLHLAEQGHVGAQIMLGAMYVGGEGVAADKVQALMWISLAAANGDEDAKKAKALLAKTMTPAQIEEAEKLARERKPNGRAAAGPMEDARAAFERGDYASAAALFRSLAEQGRAAAQVMLGTMYDEGRGVPQDHVEAVNWYRKAAEQENALAQRFLGLAYASGEGVPQDYAEAVKWWRKAAEQGDAGAQTLLGAAYNDGEHISKDPAEAAKWYRMAAEQGEVLAQFDLGFMYVNGEGVPRDYVQAYKWWILAASKGHGLAGAFVSDPFVSITPAQMAEAKKLAREWKPE